MKYIRTNDNKIYNTNELIKCEDKRFPDGWFTKNGVPLIAKQEADTIEELCDEFVLFYDSEETKPDLTYRGGFNDLYFQNELKHSAKCYGAIWTDKGLIYVAKMNDKGELELL